MSRRRGLLAAAGSGTVAGSALSTGALIIPGGSGFLTPANPTNLVQDWLFNGGSLPSGWTARNNVTEGYPNLTFNSSQVTLTGSAAQLALNSWGGATPYQAGWIDTNPGWVLPANQRARIRAWIEMPAAYQGVWPAFWMAGPSGNYNEIDIVEMNLNNATTVYGTLHQYAPEQSYTLGSYSGTLGSSASSSFHIYEVIKETGMMTWGIDGVAFAQVTAAQAAAQGYTWSFDGNQYYLIANNAVTTAGVFGPSWNTNNNSAFPLNMLVQEVQVWQ